MSDKTMKFKSSFESHKEVIYSNMIISVIFAYEVNETEYI